MNLEVLMPTDERDGPSGFDGEPRMTGTAGIRELRDQTNARQAKRRRADFESAASNVQLGQGARKQNQHEYIEIGLIGARKQNLREYLQKRWAETNDDPYDAPDDEPLEAHDVDNFTDHDNQRFSCNACKLLNIPLDGDRLQEELQGLIRQYAINVSFAQMASFLYMHYEFNGRLKSLSSEGPRLPEIKLPIWFRCLLNCGFSPVIDALKRVRQSEAILEYLSATMTYSMANGGGLDERTHRTYMEQTKLHATLTEKLVNLARENGYKITFGDGAATVSSNTVKLKPK